MPPSGERIPIEKCLNSVQDLSKQAMSSDQLHSRLSVLLNGSTKTSTTNANYGSGHIVHNYGSGSNTHSNNTYNSGGGNITFAKEDIEDEIRNAFWVTDPQSHKEDIQERKGGLIEGSYRWVLQDEHFTKWYKQEYSLLWLNGDPGKGKTMSVCGIIDHISASSDSNTILSYFFCDASDSNLNNATSILRSIIYSIIFQNSMALSYIRERFKELSKPLSDARLAWPVLQKIFVGIFSAINDQKTYLIIDALDECREDRAKLLEFIVKQSTSLPVKWLLSSRRWPVIKEVLTTCPELLKLSLEDNEEDVSAAVGLYISKQVEALSEVKRYGEKRKEAVEDHLRSKSNNTFLWVSLVCGMLKEIPAWQTMKKLDSLPTGLDALYGRMLGDLGSDELYPRIISFTLVAFRPLSLDELYYLVDEQQIAVEDIKEIVELCGSFLTIQHRVVHFIHDSAKDYLLDEASGFRFDSKQQHAVLFSQSLSNLTRSLQRDILRLESCNPRTVREGLGSISYQCLHWISHLTESEPSIVTPELKDGGLVDRFLRQRFLFWLEALGHLKSVSLGISEMLKLEHVLNSHTSQLKDLVEDEVRFIRYHRLGIEQFPLQVYPSLKFTPHKSMTRQTYESEAPSSLIVQQGIPDYWSGCILTLEGHTSLVTCVAFSYDGCLLASGSWDRTVKIWDVSTGACLHTLLAHDDWVNVVAFSPKNHNIATGSDDGTVKVWDASNGVLIKTIYGCNSPISALSFSKNGNLIATGASDGTIKLLDSIGGECKQTLIIDDGPSTLTSIAFSHDDQILSCGTFEFVLILDVEDQTEPYTIDGGYGDGDGDESVGYETVISSHKDELFLLRDGNVEVWDPAMKTCIRKIPYPASSLITGRNLEQSVILSRHGTLLGVIVNSEVKILNPSTFEWVTEFNQVSMAASVSPTSDILALTNYGNAINI
ncbi:hypothetical protein NW768_008609 [Fusarium equiseti]|uniref:NACHT domain-containing protein n=1 Tax=Fusarium equiseti TaxID=61235 RepID=A0ABQ8R4I2_FUSEQ|nr:hypothetical protein NW768_008609 [Fusarium equiseti]